MIEDLIKKLGEHLKHKMGGTEEAIGEDAIAKILERSGGREALALRGQLFNSGNTIILKDAVVSIRGAFESSDHPSPYPTIDGLISRFLTDQGFEVTDGSANINFQKDGKEFYGTVSFFESDTSDALRRITSSVTPLTDQVIAFGELRVTISAW